MSIEYRRIRKHAATRAERRALVWALGRSWDRCPQLRFGQLIANAIDPLHTNLFDVPDDALVDEVAVFARDNDSSDDYVEPPKPPVVMRLATPDYGDAK